MSSIKPARLENLSEPPAPPVNKPARSRFSFFPALWTVASVLSLVINVILLIALFLIGRELFILKGIVGDDLLRGLYENFIYMDQAHIKTTITVEDTIPIDFSLPINKETSVTLTQDTYINGATVMLDTGGVSINSLANIILPAGTTLPIQLNMEVPVTTKVPVKLLVPVDIALDQTDLHKPFIGLQQVVAPFYNLLAPQIKSAEDLPLCKPLSYLCNLYFVK